MNVRGLIVAGAAIVVTLVVVLGLLSQPERQTISATTLSTTTTSPPHLAAVPLPSGSVVLFNIRSSGVLQPTAQIPANEIDTLYFSCLGSATLTFSFGGTDPFLTTPCLNEVQAVEMPKTVGPEDVVPSSSTSDSWHVIAVKGSIS